MASGTQETRSNHQTDVQITEVSRPEGSKTLVCLVMGNIMLGGSAERLKRRTYQKMISRRVSN